MFADLALARRIDRAESTLSSDIADAIIRRQSVAGAFCREIGGGVAVYTGTDSPMSKVIGAGFDGAPDAEALEGVEAAYFSHGASVRAEVSTLADPAMVQQLTGRGYVLKGFENVLARRLDGIAHDGPAPPDALDIVEVRRDSEWMGVLIDGFESPDTGVVSAPGESFPREALERTFEDMADARGFKRYLARMAGDAAGGASMRLSDGIAQLCGAATLPRFRRRGVQTAMLFARLREAAAAGCDLAVVTTEPGSRSQQNVQRAGFVLLYSRAVLVRSPPSPEA